MMPDFTDIWTAEGWLYVAVVLDLFSRCAVGWSMKADRDASLVMDALMMTGRRFLAFLVAEVRCQLRAQHPFHELDLQLFHQPCFAEQILRALNALQQFIQKFLGDRHACFLSMKHGPDHSYTEDLTLSSFFSTLKTERTTSKVYRTRNEARTDVIDYIERFYNPRRRHSKLGYSSSMEFEACARLVFST